MVKRFLRARRGSTVVEFGLIAGAFVLVIQLIIETTWQLATGVALDDGARVASRWAATGTSPPEGLTAGGYVSQLVATASGFPLDAAALSVTVESFADLSMSGTARPGTGGSGDIVRYTIQYDSVGITPAGQVLLTAGMLRHRLVVVKKNEPFTPG